MDEIVMSMGQICRDPLLSSLSSSRESQGCLEFGSGRIRIAEQSAQHGQVSRSDKVCAEIHDV